MTVSTVCFLSLSYTILELVLNVDLTQGFLTLGWLLAFLWGWGGVDKLFLKIEMSGPAPSPIKSEFWPSACTYFK